MRSLCALLVGAMALGGVARAQTTTEPSKGYIEGVAQSAFGNVTSQSYGGEVGVTVWKNLQVFAEFGQIRNVTPTELGASAQVIAGFLSQTQSGVSVTVKEPATFGVGGVRYVIPVTGVKVEPYVMGGVGIAQVTKNVSYAVAGSDVTASLTQLGVVLGSDLSGQFTKPMLVIGGGVAWPIWQHLVIDVQVRFSRISAEDQDSKVTSVGRAGVGVGFRF